MSNESFWLWKLKIVLIFGCVSFVRSSVQTFSKIIRSWIIVSMCFCLYRVALVRVKSRAWMNEHNFVIHQISNQWTNQKSFCSSWNKLNCFSLIRKSFNWWWFSCISQTNRSVKAGILDIIESEAKTQFVQFVCMFVVGVLKNRRNGFVDELLQFWPE